MAFLGWAKGLSSLFIQQGLCFVVSRESKVSNGHQVTGPVLNPLALFF